MQQTLDPQLAARTSPLSSEPRSGSPAAAELPLPRNPRYASLDIWRGVACLMVVVFHGSLYATQWGPDASETTSPGLNLVKFVLKNMQMGVPLFFVISGYCIAATSDSTRRQPHALRRFFVRRFRRIFPPYWIAVALTLGLVVVVAALGWPPLFFADPGSAIVHFPNPLSLTAAQWLGNATLTESWRAHLFGAPSEFLLGQAWSLCYEEQFYALCGLLLLVAPRRFFAGTAVITAAILVLAPVALFEGASISGFFFDGRWLLFALGLLVYYRLNYPPGKVDGLLSLFFCLGPGVFLAFIFGLLNPEGNGWLVNLSYEMTIGSLFSLLLLFLHGRDTVLVESRALRPLGFCGKMCYSLYLVHWPIAEVIGLACYHLGVRHIGATLLTTVPLVTALSIGAAWVFYQLVERRFLNASSYTRVPTA